MRTFSKRSSTVADAGSSSGCDIFKMQTANSNPTSARIEPATKSIMCERSTTELFLLREHRFLRPDGSFIGRSGATAGRIIVSSHSSMVEHGSKDPRSRVRFRVRTYNLTRLPLPPKRAAMAIASHFILVLPVCAFVRVNGFSSSFANFKQTRENPSQKWHSSPTTALIPPAR